MKKVILLAGPTASGKSELAIYIAKKINGEIINADSMQVFKEIKILSARPEDYKNIKHHLYGFVSVKKSFSTGEWIKHTEKKINEILEKKKTPIIVGGTELYETVPGLMDNIEYGFDTLATLTGGAIIHRGIYEDPEREKLVAYTIVGGLKSPKKRIEELKKFLVLK